MSISILKTLDKLNVEPEHAVEILRLADRFGIGSLKHNATVLIEAC